MAWTAPPVAAVGDVFGQRFWDPLSRQLAVLGLRPMSSVVASPTTTSLVNNNGNENINFDTVKVDQDPTGMPIFDPSRKLFVCRTAGWYLGRMQVQWVGDAQGGTLQHGWEKNGVQIMQGDRGNPNRLQGWPVMVVTFLSVDDTLRPFVWWQPTVGGAYGTHQTSLSLQADVPSANIRLVSL
jgi:hypothetical protein